MEFIKIYLISSRVPVFENLQNSISLHPIVCLSIVFQVRKILPTIVNTKQKNSRKATIRALVPTFEKKFKYKFTSSFAKNP